MKGNTEDVTWNSHCSFFPIHSVTWVKVTSITPSMGRTWRSNVGGTLKLYLRPGGIAALCRQCKSKQVKMCLCTRCEYHILSVGGGGMLMVRVPESSRTSTLSIRGRLDTSAIFFCMYLFSVAFLKYLDFAILPTNRRIFRPVLPPVGLCPNKTKTQMEL